MASHLALLAPLERARLDADARRSLAARGDVVVGAPYQVRRRVDSVADEAHCRVRGDPASFVRFPEKSVAVSIGTSFLIIPLTLLSPSVP